MSEDGERVCVVCQSKDKPKLCSSCQSVSYCCKEHQVQHWKIHKASCVKPKPADLGALASAMATLDVSPHRGQCCMFAPAINVACTKRMPPFLIVNDVHK